jgi:hypothetical protein
MINETQPKVFCIGWHKTGTSTLGDALLALGYTVTGARLDLAHSLMDGEIEPALRVAEQFEALQDVPWAALFKELDTEFPNSKFVLTVRGEEEWLNSAKKHFKDRYGKIREWLYGKGVLEGNEKLYLERYRKHYQDVEVYFKDRQDDIIIMDFKQGDGWEKLCAFLDKPIPRKAFPHSNKGKHNYNLKDKIISYIRRFIPKPLRVWRVEILEKLDLHKGRDRFNNKEINRKEINTDR